MTPAERRAARGALGLTCRAVAAEARVSESAVSYAEKGRGGAEATDRIDLALRRLLREGGAAVIASAPLQRVDEGADRPLHPHEPAA